MMYAIPYLSLLSLLSDFAIATSYRYAKSDTELHHICNPPPSFLWSMITSLTSFTLIVGYAMMFVSPLTRQYARDILALVNRIATEILNTFRYLAHSFVERVWTGVPANEVARLKQVHAEEIARITAKREDATTTQSQHTRTPYEHRGNEIRQLKDENETLTAENTKLQSELSAAEKELSDHKSGRIFGPLHGQVRARDQKIHALEVENTYLRSEATTWEKRETELHDGINKKAKEISEQEERAQELLTAKQEAETRQWQLRKEKEAMEVNMKKQDEDHEDKLKQQAQEHKAVIQNKDYMIAQNYRVLEALHHMAEQTNPEYLAAAVAFAKFWYNEEGLQLAALEVDQRRLELLIEFVRLGQGSNLAIQPQVTHRGFRLGQLRPASDFD